MSARPEASLWITLNCRTCEFAYEVYEPSRDEVASPECSSCVIDRAFLPVELAVEKFRRARSRHRSIPVAP